MAKKSFINYLLNPKNWWLPLLIIFVASITGVLMIGVHTYTEAPPIATYISLIVRRFHHLPVLTGNNHSCSLIQDAMLPL